MSNAEAAELQRYTELHQRLSHAMQTGVKIEQEKGIAPDTPKTLRVGINVALVDHAALVGLLIKKGVFTQREYLEAITDAMKDEVARYEDRLRAHGVIPEQATLG